MLKRTTPLINYETNYNWKKWDVVIKAETTNNNDLQATSTDQTKERKENTER